MAYVYRHIRLDKNVPFYIGIGTDKKYTRANSDRNRNKHWRNIVSGTGYEVEILFDDIDLEFAKEKEKEFILLYGRSDINKGSLCNLTDGGEGCLGLVHTEESRLKMGIPNKGKIISEEHRKIISLFHTGKVTSEETKRKISEAQSGEKHRLYGKKIPESTRLKQIKSAKRGEENKASKLTEKDVLEIRRMHSECNYSSRKIAKIFSVAKNSISSILNKKTWKHI
jgi:hypothetical protein